MVTANNDDYEETSLAYNAGVSIMYQCAEGDTDGKR